MMRVLVDVHRADGSRRSWVLIWGDKLMRKVDIDAGMALAILIILFSVMLAAALWPPVEVKVLPPCSMFSDIWHECNPSLARVP